MTNLKQIEETAKSFNNDEELIKKELKRIQSIKCRLKKQKGKKSYEQEMTEILQNEQILKEAKNLINPKEKFVTEYTKDDIKILSHEETTKAIRSIQSKKTLTRWLNDREGDNDEYRKAVEIEKLLIEHREKVKPVDDNLVRKTEIQKIIEVVQDNEKLSKKQLLELLEKLK